MLDKISEKFDVFVVGGKVRDDILGIPSNDIDYCVVATKEEFELHFPELECVGNSFPVYLNPSCGSEIALTRQEISTGDCYTDFDIIVGVSIELDLSRRDAACNSLACHYITKEIIDPFNGISDIKNKIIRTHNPKAFEEDSLRIYRLLRQAVQFEFEVDSQTLQLMKESIGKLKSVNPERVYVELKKMYERSKTPSRFFDLLDEVGGLDIHFPFLKEMKKYKAGPSHTKHYENSIYKHTMISIDKCKERGYSFSVFLSVLLHDIGKLTSAKSESYVNGRHHYKHEIYGLDLVEEVFNNHRFTSHQMKLIKCVVVNHMIHNIKDMRDIKLIRFYNRVKHVFDEFVKACDCDSDITEDQMKIFSNLKRTFKETDIDVPKEILNKGKEAVVNFVEQKYAKKYREIKLDNQ